MKKLPANKLLPFVSATTLAALLAACGTTPKAPVSEAPRATNQPPVTVPVLPKANSGKGGYYKDDGPGDNPPPGLEFTVDPIPKIEPYARGASKPYVVFGKTFTPINDDTTPFIQRGLASWYGKKFHGQRTSSGEPYDMYKITAAHPTLPIPSYARVTNLSNGRQIIVRVNDRGPFQGNRIIDLSYTAALKLEVLGKGSTQIEVERLLPADIERMAENRKNQPPQTIRSASADPVVNTPVAMTSPIPQQAMPVPAALEDAGLTQNTRPVEKLSTPPAIPAGSGFYLQFGAFAIRSNAENVMSQLKGKAESRLPAFEIVQQGSLYRLVSGPFTSRAEAQQALAMAGDLGTGKPVVVQR